MKRLLLGISGCASLSIGGVMSLLLLIARVDPPGLLMAQFMGLVAGGIVAGGVLALGKAIFPDSECRVRSVTRTLAFISHLTITVGLAAWHNTIITARKNASVRRERMDKESLERHPAPFPEPRTVQER
jgi:hypothetical protein